MADAPENPESFYDDYGREEWRRLRRSLHGRLEWEGTTEYLKAHLPASGRVLDAGGGAGRYAVWLAERGHEVTLVDVSAEQCAIAREEVAKRGLGDRVTVQRGDVRNLAFADGAFDATLCLGGPLSHVLDADGREAAARELARVTADGGPVFASVMGRLNFLQILLGGHEKLAAVPEIAETGDYAPAVLAEYGYDQDFAPTHFFRVDEFEALLEAAGLAVDRVVGLEGLASCFTIQSLRETTEELDGERRERVRDLVERQREDRTVADLSAHMLAVCEAPASA